MKSLWPWSSQRTRGTLVADKTLVPWWEYQGTEPPAPPGPPELTDDEHLICLRLGKRITAGGFQIPSIPLVAAETLSLLERGNPEFHELAKLIRRDQQLAADVVSFANSALFARVMDVSNIPQAIARVGLHRTRSLVLASSLRRLIYSTCDLTRAERLWKHSVGCAAVASCIANNWRTNPDDAYLAGLFHDVGKAIVLSLLGTATLDRKPVPRRSAFVEHVLELYHEGVGVAVTTEWKLAPTVVEAIRKHTETENATFTKTQAIVVLANNVCHRLRIGETDDGRPIAREATLQALGADEGDLGRLLDGVKSVIDRAP